jgi:hypothetical protein
MSHQTHEAIGTSGDQRPTYLNPTDKLVFTEISRDKLTATYVGKGHHPQDVGVCIATVTTPAPVAMLMVTTARR